MQSVPHGASKAFDVQNLRSEPRQTHSMGGHPVLIVDSLVRGLGLTVLMEVRTRAERASWGVEGL